MSRLGPIHRNNGVAGQIAYSVTVTHEGEGPEQVSFIGSVYGGPVVMAWMGEEGPMETFVSDPDRFGKFSPEWVRRFFA